MKQATFVMRHLTVVTAMSMAAVMLSPAANAEITGNIGVYSKYVLRGITNVPETESPAVQGGLDYSHASGFYAGYWGSSLGYGTRGTAGAYTSTPTPTTPNGFESDIYGGYGFTVIGVLVLQVLSSFLIGVGLKYEWQQFIFGLLILPMVALYGRSPHIRAQV